MRIRKLKKICYNSKFTRSDYIYKLVASGILNEQIKKIKFTKIQTSMYQTFPKGKTNSYSLFLLNIDKFLMFLEFNFLINTTEKFVVLKNILESEKSDIFISTKDINDERDWYILQYKKLIIEKFYITLKRLYKNNENMKIKLDKIIDINNISLKNNDDVDKIFDFLKDVINCSRENIRCLFLSYEQLISNEMYLDLYFELFDTYEERKIHLKPLGL